MRAAFDTISYVEWKDLKTQLRLHRQVLAWFKFEMCAGLFSPKEF